MRILVFGDSIVYGAWDEEGGWVQRLRKFIDMRMLSQNFDPYYTVYNLGVSGDKTSDLIKRLDEEIPVRIEEKDEVMIIFGIGINDSGRKVDLVTFEGNLSKIIKTSKKFASKIVFIGLTPVDESKTVPTGWDDSLSYDNQTVQKYDEVIKSVCKLNDVQFVEIFNVMIKKDYKKLLEDGLHPNSDGHKEIFNIVKAKLFN